MEIGPQLRLLKCSVNVHIFKIEYRLGKKTFV